MKSLRDCWDKQMKITKSRLKEIIKEEVEKVVKEITLPSDRYGRQSAADARAVRAGLDSTSEKKIDNLIKQGLKALARKGIKFDYKNDKEVLSFYNNNDHVDRLETWVDKRMRDNLPPDDFDKRLRNVLGLRLNEEELDELMGSGPYTDDDAERAEREEKLRKKEKRKQKK